MTPRAEATQRRLFEATMRLARGTGIAGVTVDHIAAAAGVAKGTVYYNFGSKDRLIEALLRYGIGELAERLTTAVDEVAGDPSAELAALIDAALAFIEQYPGFSQILVSELWRTPGNWAETLAPLREEILTILERQLERVAATRRFPAGVPVRRAATALFGTLLVTALDWLVFEPHRDRSEVRDSVLTLLAARAEPG
ncbi:MULTISPECIES: TetR/AcrR family transcriptional regulator [Prauserella salsuginis group]|uniref:TetR/AcrR family transcriptional regulator n=1 Tax=Prauserella salsuginis TaxID=387889 RepID=A0ABW6G1R3_9PSEU|nr:MULTISPECIES: TetR/AcrR family transcriptional regulator [Prauserella salsuginis group]MCR3722288.1 transcriptional regulator, TetR family [Prauserella flava]MCR3736286.1 transcriptional regulator, TetR family [Prauserella salsuginis]